MRALSVGILAGVVLAPPVMAAEPAPAEVLKTYADIALATFTDALQAAEALDRAVGAFVADPGNATLATARQAYIDARIPYQQSEAFRFGNPVVDDWEGRVNAWPLDEGLIDYVDASTYGTESDENPLFTANIVANPKITIEGKDVDASNLTPAFLRSIAEAGGIEANVTTGYHAIEFLLWGQDTHGTGPGAGERPATDYSLIACTHGNCDRRGQYLKSAVELLVADLKEMVADWGPDGAALKSEQASGLGQILTGMGSLSYGELGGERMKLGLILHDPEEEHECFSDTTYLAYRNDAIGIQNVYLGKYVRTAGSVVEGPSISGVIAAKDATLDTEIRSLLADTVARFDAMKVRGDTIEKYDQMIAEGNTEGNAAVQAAIDGLIAQTRGIERAVSLLGLDVTVEGSDSLDNRDAVFQ